MKKNKQLNLYFNDKPIKSKETDYQESRINIVISVFLIFFFHHFCTTIFFRI